MNTGIVTDYQQTIRYTSGLRIIGVDKEDCQGRIPREDETKDYIRVLLREWCRPLTLTLILLLSGSMESSRGNDSLPQVPESKWVTTIRDDGCTNTFNVTGGETIRIIPHANYGDYSIIRYPWQGEDTIYYEFEGMYCFVNGAKVGCLLSNDSVQSVEEPEKILAIGWEDNSIPFASALSRFPNLKTVDLYLKYYRVSDLKNLKKIPGQVDLYIYAFFKAFYPGSWYLFKNLKGLTNLRELNVEELVYGRIWSYSMSNRNLRYLRGLENLRELSLPFAFVKDGGVRYISELSNLEGLSIESPFLTARGIRHLTKLKRLQVLDIGWARLSDKGFEYIGELKSLKGLYLHRWKGNTLHDLVTFKKTCPEEWRNQLPDWWFLGEFKALFVPRTTSSCWKHLEKLPNLWYLSLIDLRLNSEDLDGIGRLKQLKWLSISRGDYTEADLEKLKQRLPNCTIEVYKYLWG